MVEVIMKRSSKLMKKHMKMNVCCIPLILWLVIIPVVVKVKFFPNPLIEYPWYSGEATLADFFLYYKSILITITGILMIIMLAWQISQMRRKESLVSADTRIFIPVIVYLALVIFSSLFSQYGYFCTHGMPDQFETVWNLIAYVVALFYCYYVTMYKDSDTPILTLIFMGAALVGVICALQYFKIDIYRLIYAGDGYTFTFAEGQVYGPFYNINYVGYYVLLFVPLFIMLAALYSDVKVKIISGILAVLLLISMWGADSSAAWVAFVAVCGFAVLFLLLKHAKTKKLFWIPIAAIIVGAVCVGVMLVPRMEAYIQASNYEKRNLENIYTNDDAVEIEYKGEKLFVQMTNNGETLSFSIQDQNQTEVSWEQNASDGGYYYSLTDERFAGITITPVMITEEPAKYGFMVCIDDKNWCFTNEMTDDGTYYYYTDLGKLTKLTEENVSGDFGPLVNVSSLANGRGYIWNKTISLLKHYIVFGSGADTYALVYPNDDFVDKYNNGYDNLIITKPHNMYLQIAVQTGVLSLICFLVFYLWYFISSVRIYFKQRLDSLPVIMGFSIMLGTMGYMISGLANDSTVTVSPLFWALMGVGIAINCRIKKAAEKKE